MVETIKQKDEQIQQQKRTIEEKEAAIEEKEATIKEKEKTIESLQDEALINQAADRTNTENATTTNHGEQETHATNEQNKLLNALASQTKRLAENIRTKEDSGNINKLHRTRIEMVQPFHGLHTENFESWFFVVEKFQQTNKIKDEDMLDVLTPVFRGNALLMLKRFENNNGRGKYREFMEKLRNLTDMKVTKDNLRKKLDQLVQRDSFESYIQKFMGWVQQIDDMADSELLYRFESGLKPDARNQLSFMKAKNFDEAVMIVSRFEANKKGGREDHTNKLNYTKTHFPKANNKWTAKARNKVAFNNYRRPEWIKQQRHNKFQNT